MKKQHIAILASFIIGLIIAFASTEIYKSIVLDSYKKSSRLILDIDPYKYDSLTKASLTYFYTSLPHKLQIHIDTQFPAHDALTSCEGDIIPGKNAEFVVSFINGKDGKVLVYELDDNFVTKNTYDLSKMISFKKSNDDDYLELQCRHAAYILNSPHFKLNEKEKSLAETIQLENREVIQLKSRQSDNYGIFAYGVEDQKFHQLGTSSTSEK